MWELKKSMWWAEPREKVFTFCHSVRPAPVRQQSPAEEFSGVNWSWLVFACALFSWLLFWTAGYRFLQAMSQRASHLPIELPLNQPQPSTLSDNCSSNKLFILCTVCKPNLQCYVFTMLLTLINNSSTTADRNIVNCTVVGFVQNTAGSTFRTLWVNRRFPAKQALLAKTGSSSMMKW